MNLAHRFSARIGKALLCTALLPCAHAWAAVPPVVMSNHQTVFSSLTNGTSRVSADARGDLFFVDFANKTLLELPVGSTTPITLLINMNGPHSVNIDSSGNLYANNSYQGRVIRVPLRSDGTYPTNIDASSTAVSALTCSQGMQVDCVLPTLGVLTGYYSQTSDTAWDAAGDYFFVDPNDSVSTGAYNRILELTAGGTVKVLFDHLAEQGNAQIVSDAAGNLFYANNVGLYSIPAGYTTMTQMNATTLNKPSGVTFDNYGNLIVSDSGNSRIVVIPFENGALNFAHQYLLVPQYSQNSVAIDSFGTIYYTGSAGGATSISALQTSVYSPAPLAVGSSNTSALVYAVFNAPTTFSTYYTRGNGAVITEVPNNCVLGTTYTANQSCSFNVSIKPTRVGSVAGIVGVGDASGNALAQFAFSAVGLGSAVAIDPGISASIASSGLTAPAGVAVDLAGNVFVADTTANAVYEYVGGTGSTISVGTGLSGPTGVSVDAAGDLFIADAGNARVVEVPNLGVTLQTTSQITIAANLTSPIAVACGPQDALYIAQGNSQLVRYAVRGVPPSSPTVLSTQVSTAPRALTVDPSGNVFIADGSSGRILKWTTTTTGALPEVVTGLTSPSALAIDAAGDLFLVDSGTAQVEMIPNISGTLSQANAVSLGTFNSPAGLASDSAANVFVSDPSVPAIYKVTRTTGRLDFGNVGYPSTSPALKATLTSSGNQTLTLGTPLYTVSGDSTHFAVVSASTCSAASTLAAGNNCSLAATFSPTATGQLTQVLALNASPTVATTPFNLTLTGYGTFLVSTSLNVALTAPSGSLIYGQPATFTATLTPSTFNVAQPTGTVTFVINGVKQKPITLSGNSVSIQTTALFGGSNTIYATYSGDINYAPSSSSTNTVNVAKANTTTSLSVVTAFVNPASSPIGSAVQFTAVVTPSVAGVLTGSVNFVSGSTTIGTAPIGSGYQAILTTTSIPAGTYNVTAVFPGSANYSSSSSSATTLLVSAPGIYLTSASNTISSSSSSSGQTTLSVASVSGLGSLPNFAPVSFSCSGLPAFATCIFTPAYIVLEASPAATPVLPTAVGLSIQVNYNPGQPLPPVSSLGRRGGLFLALLLGLPWLGLRRRGTPLLRSLVFLCLLLPASLCLIACGSGGSSSTPAGTYPITVTATSSTATTSIPLNFTVTN